MGRARFCCLGQQKSPLGCFLVLSDNQHYKPVVAHSCHWLFLWRNTMAQFCIEIPDDKVAAVMSAMGAQYGYKSEIPNPNFDRSAPEDPSTNPSTIVNPEILTVFVNRITREWITNNVKAHNAKVAADAARQAAIDATDLNITDPQL